MHAYSAFFPGADFPGNKRPARVHSAALHAPYRCYYVQLFTNPYVTVKAFAKDFQQFRNSKPPNELAGPIHEPEAPVVMLR